ncbi:DUF3298 domain-containing protein [Devosia riboflavina]|uniref:DUF3298 domain-containing protein n=1 Tax=Devosia riboflavina TaxID=46914 RepID=UPI00068AA7AD|nr:DUF3298 domain-containing protein [Devosia riboflavina]
MFRFALLFVLAFFASFSLPAAAASFDCAKAATPFEHAICDSPELSAADDRLAKTYQTAIGGLSEGAVAAVRGDQRAWLDFAQRACAPEAEPMTSGRYNEDRTRCLINRFDSRSSALEDSRMINGMRFYVRARFDAMPDPNAENADSYWAVAQHELSYVQLDSTEPFAGAFNAYVEGEALKLSGLFGEEGGSSEMDEDASSDTNNSIGVAEANANRIDLNVGTYWYGHGAAHGNWSKTFLHYLVDEDRELAARDIFTGKRWQAGLLDLTVEALKAEHGDALMLDDTSYIADAVTDPARWDLSDPYALILQFQPYEVSAYAYGAPTARISLEKLAPYISEDSDFFRY